MKFLMFFLKFHQRIALQLFDIMEPPSQRNLSFKLKVLHMQIKAG